MKKYILTSDYTAKRFSNTLIKNAQEKSFKQNDIIEVKEITDYGMNKRLITSSTPNGSTANNYVLLDFEVTNAPMKLYAENNSQIYLQNTNSNINPPFLQKNKNYLIMVGVLLAGYFAYKKFKK